MRRKRPCGKDLYKIAKAVKYILDAVKNLVDLLG